MSDWFSPDFPLQYGGAYNSYNAGFPTTIFGIVPQPLLVSYINPVFQFRKTI